MRSAEDRISVSVTLTEGGQRLIEKIFPQHLGAIVSEFEVLGAREQEDLRSLCRKLGKQEKN